MKILHLNEHLAWRGGIETYLLSLKSHLASNGYVSAFAFAKGEQNLAKNAFCVEELASFGKKKELSAYQRVSHILKDQRIDVAHIHNVHNIGAVSACLDHVPTIVTGHDYRYLCPASNFFYRRSKSICHRTCGPGCFTTTIRHRCMTPRPSFALNYYRRVKWVCDHANRFAHVVAPSHSAHDRFIQAGFDHDNVSVVPYFCPLSPLPKPRPLPSQKTILFMGRFSGNKGVESFVAALSKLSRDVRGVMIGASSPAQEMKILSQAKTANCSERLEVRSWANRDDIVNIMSEASVLVFPSIWPETLGIVGLEALACGVPVVASDVGGVREWLKPNTTGLLVPPNDSSSLASACAKLIDNTELQKSMSEAGLKLIADQFLPSQHVCKLVRIYDQAACQRNRLPSSPVVATESLS